MIICFFSPRRCFHSRPASTTSTPPTRQPPPPRFRPLPRVPAPAVGGTSSPGRGSPSRACRVHVSRGSRGQSHVVSAVGTRGGYGKKGVFLGWFDLVPVAVVPRPFALLLLLLLLGFFLPVLLLFPFLVLPVTPVPAVAVAARPAAAARAGPPHRRLARDQASDHKARAVEGIRTGGWALRAVCIDGGRSSAPRAHRARWRRVEARRELPLRSRLRKPVVTSAASRSQ